jgi:hypothetical protein
MVGTQTQPIDLPNAGTEQALGEFPLEQQAPRSGGGKAKCRPDDPVSEFLSERPEPDSGKVTLRPDDPGGEVLSESPLPAIGVRGTVLVRSWPPPGVAPAFAPRAPRRRRSYKTLLVSAAVVSMGTTLVVVGFLTVNRATTPVSPPTSFAEAPVLAPVLEAADAPQPSRGVDVPASRQAYPADAEGIETPSRIRAMNPQGNRDVAASARVTPASTEIPPRVDAPPALLGATANPMLSAPGLVAQSPEPVGIFAAGLPSATIVAPARTSGLAAENPEVLAAQPSTSPVVLTTPAPTSRTLVPATETGAIEHVLGRYRSAFNGLDVGAAQEVWPTVNERTLGRAFDRLETQAFSFERCLIGVTGLQAEASCSGTARYVPRIGNKNPHIEPRQWTFSLRKVSDEWLIEAVDAR